MAAPKAVAPAAASIPAAPGGPFQPRETHSHRDGVSPWGEARRSRADRCASAAVECGCRRKSLRAGPVGSDQRPRRRPAGPQPGCNGPRPRRLRPSPRRWARTPAPASRHPRPPRPPRRPRRLRAPGPTRAPPARRAARARPAVRKQTGPVVEHRVATRCGVSADPGRGADGGGHGEHTRAIPTAAADPCPDIEVIFARSNSNAIGLGDTGQAFVDALRSRIGDRSLAVYSVNHPASLDFGPRSRSVPPTPPPGAVDGRQLSEHQACAERQLPGRQCDRPHHDGSPTARVQGTPVPMPPQVADHVAAVAVFGNPAGTTPGGGPLPAMSSLYGAKTIDLCAPDDMYCDPGGQSFSPTSPTCRTEWLTRRRISSPPDFNRDPQSVHWVARTSGIPGNTEPVFRLAAVFRRAERPAKSRCRRTRRKTIWCSSKSIGTPAMGPRSHHRQPAGEIPPITPSSCAFPPDIENPTSCGLCSFRLRVEHLNMPISSKPL